MPRLFLRWQNRLRRKEARMSDKLLEAVQDHTSLVQALQFILEAAETKKLPPYGVLPVFNDDLLNDRLKGILELVTGEKYP